MKTKELTSLAMLLAITILLGIIPNIGIIQIGLVSLTILHIPVIVAGLMFGIKGASITGLVFGLTSLYVASTRAVFPIDLLFVNPLISVLPRLLFGFITGIICEKLVKKENIITYGIVGFSCSVIHTMLVYIALYIWGQKTLNIDIGVLSFFKYIVGAISINSIIEAIVAGVISALLMKGIKRLKRR
ncbi:MAG: ECF transporter S component [Erysipelotrichaceae bacterium]|nr:ECF transporter S component [Erysipelotrichaceae bacterium]